MSTSHTKPGPSPVQMRANLIRGDLDRAKRYLTLAMDSAREHGSWALSDSIRKQVACVEILQIEANDVLSDEQEVSK